MKTLLLPLLALSLSACSIGVKSDEKPAAEVNPFAHAVTGPSLDGVWSSGCNDTGYSSQKIVMTVKGQSFSRVTQSFTDRDCLNADKTITLTGQFRYKALVRSEGPDKVFEAEYKIDLGNGWSQLRTENIKPTLSVLYVSNFRVGEALARIPLVKTSGAKTTAAHLDESESFENDRF